MEKKWRVKIDSVGTPEELKDNQTKIVKFILELMLKQQVLT